MLTLLIGKDWIRNRDAILNMLVEDIRNERENRILMVPELISHDTEFRLCMAAGNTTSRFAEVLSFTRLAQRVSEAVGHGENPCLDNGGRIVAMGAAARQLHGQLKTYASVETKPELLAGIIEAVDEFKRCCISPEDLMQASRLTEGVLAQKMEELSLLLQAYDAICFQGKRDPRDQMTWLLEQLEDCDFAQKHVFYIDGFPDFTRQHMAILEHLVLHAKDVVISLNCDEPGSKNLAFEKAGQTALDLLLYAKRVGIPVHVQYVEQRDDRLAPVRELLFRGNVGFMDQLKGHLMISSAKTVYDECLAAAEQIINLVEGGARYRDISVVCANMSGYRNLIDLAFRRCRIPYYLSGTEAVLDKSVITTVLSAIDVAVGGFAQPDVIRYMKSILSPLDIHESDKLENYAIMWNIGGKRWETEFTNHPKGLTEHWSSHDIRDLEQLNHDRKTIIEPLSQLQKGFRDAGSVKEQVRALYDFLERIHYAERLAELAAQMDREGDSRNAQILNQLWDILLAALEQLYDVLGDVVWDTETFSRLLRLLLSQYNVGTIPPMLDVVTVGPVSAMRCQQAPHLIVLGAAEGCLPGYSGSRGVLTDQERTALRTAGLPLTGGAMEGVQAEFAEIYGVFCAAEKTISISCSQGLPSIVYRRLLALAGEEKVLDTQTTAARVNPLEAASLLVRNQDIHAAAKLDIAYNFDVLNKKQTYEPGRIKPEVIQQLYGSKLNLSASQVDKQALCRMSYFLRYGLRAKERKTLSVDPAEFGTYVHAVLENTAKDVMELGGFKTVSLEQTLQIAQKHSAEYANTHFGQLDSERLAYLFRRNSQELEFVVRELWDELHNSQFAPVGFEVGFGDGKEMAPIHIPSGSIQAQLNGFVDRVDTWTSGGKTYFRVVDYKTGKKDFDYCDVLNGMGLQMLLYLFALEDNGQLMVGEEPIAAGVQYFPARVPYILVDGIQDEEVIYDSREKAWKRKGLLLNDQDVLNAMDPDGSMGRLCASLRRDGSISGDVADSGQFKLLRAYVFLLLGKIVEEIASGCVEPNPYTRGSSENACRFCPYGAVCHPENVEGRRNYKSVSSQSFWEEVEREVKANG